jgi:hypothetical protein
MLKASLKFRTDSLHGDMPGSRTEYILGRNTRLENRSCSGHSETFPPTNVRYEYGPLRAYMQNHDLSTALKLILMRASMPLGAQMTMGARRGSSRDGLNHGSVPVRPFTAMLRPLIPGTAELYLATLPGVSLRKAHPDGTQNWSAKLNRMGGTSMRHLLG